MRKENQNDKIFSAYKPFRNQLRNFELFDSLYLIWAYSRNLIFDYPMPNDIEVPSNYLGNTENRRLAGIPEFELEFLLKEIIINSDTTKRKLTLRQRKLLKKLVNYNRFILKEEITKEYNSDKNIWIEFNRLIHNQFKWQFQYHPEIILKYYKIYNHSELKEIFYNKFGLTVYQLMIIGITFFFKTGKEFVSHPFKSTTDLITDEMFSKFCDMFSIELEELKEQLIDYQQMNENLYFSYNPLVARPIITHKKLFFSPLPIYIFWQITDGLYYSIVKENGFENAYGKAFENYIGEVLEYINTGTNQFEIYSEKKYGKPEKKTVDWILVENDAILFIECKTKRLTMPSKTSLNIDILEKDLRKMASFIFQVYKTYMDYTENLYPNLEYDSNKEFIPLILTLEDWFINLNPQIMEALNSFLIEKFETNKISTDIIKKHPYHIRSSREFENDIQIMKKYGIKNYFEKINNNTIFEYITDFQYINLFEGEFEKIFETKSR